jgi:hypothetical protein
MWSQADGDLREALGIISNFIVFLGNNDPGYQQQLPSVSDEFVGFILSQTTSAQFSENLKKDKFVPWQKLQMRGISMQRGTFAERQAPGADGCAAAMTEKDRRRAA